MAYNGWKISDASREELFKRFPPRYPDIVCHHVTHGMRLGCPDAVSLRVIGHAARDGIEALVVEVDGVSVRLDDSLFHITYSLDRATGVRSNDSNKIVRDFVHVDPIEVTSVPFWVDSENVEHMVYTVEQMVAAYAACKAIKVKPSRRDENGIPMWKHHITEI